MDHQMAYCALFAGLGGFVLGLVVATFLWLFRFTRRFNRRVIAAFTEWERQRRDGSYEFLDDGDRLATDIETFGQACDEEFLELLKQVYESERC